MLIDGPSGKGRDRHHVDDSALLREQQPSQQDRARIDKGIQDPCVHHDANIALVVCKDTIFLQTDSIRKYADKDYRYDLSKPVVSTLRTSGLRKKRGKRKVGMVTVSQ